VNVVINLGEERRRRFWRSCFRSRTQIRLTRDELEQSKETPIKALGVFGKAKVSFWGKGNFLVTSDSCFCR